MKITQNTAVTLRMKVTDSQGLIYDDGKNPVAYLHGDYDNLFPKLEAALEGQEAGFQTTLELATEDTFGERDEALVTTMPKADFPPGVKVGGQGFFVEFEFVQAHHHRLIRQRGVAQSHAHVAQHGGVGQVALPAADG